MSKFAGVLKAAKGDETAAEEDARPVSLTAARGRPRGKRSDPSFEQVTAYIRKETYRQTKLALLNAKDSRDFSQLVEELLGAYLRTQKSK
ncbi:MAG: hypothetical protein IT342_15880 [Candidatus Melainabacteria bacterium]|nr:hypothetical protein [Candidatus Melainabacteria bacterium]